MTGAELLRVREKSVMGVVEFGAALGYRGSGNTIGRLMRRFESDSKEIPAYTAEVVQWYDQHGMVQNVQEPQHTRVFRGILVHGDRDAVKAYGRLKHAQAWLRNWYYKRGDDYLRFTLLRPTPNCVSVETTPDVATSDRAAIKAQDPIATSAGGELIGARLTVLDGADQLTRWLRT